jgi:transposase
MTKELVTDALWELVQPLLPPEAPKPQGGRPRVPDRACLRGIIFVLTTGLQWSELPAELGFGSGITCWRRLKAWERADVWHRLHRVLLDHLGSAERIDWSRASLDSSSVQAKGGAFTRPRTRGRTRRIGANRAASITCWWIGPASPSPVGSRRRTSRM